MKCLEILKINIKNICKSSITIAGCFFSILSVVLSFMTWEELGIMSVHLKITIFATLLLISFVIGTFWIAIVKRNNIVWSVGDGKINICYADIMKFAFLKKSRRKKIIVIPVNTSFDTIVDEEISLCDKPLVSPTTIHGRWIKSMVRHGFKIEDIDSAIDKYIELRNIQPLKILSTQEKRRGKLKCFENGTTVIMKGKNNIEFFLVALSEFDENNRAQTSKEEVFEFVKKLVDIYDSKGQGYEMYIPLVGTGRSRAGLTHTDSLHILKSILTLNGDKIHGTINVVIYPKDRDKVSIFE